MVLPGTSLIVHNKPINCTSWSHNGTPGYYIGPSLDHYRFMQCNMPATGIVRTTDTLQYIAKESALPKTTTEDYLQQAIVEIIAILQDPPKTLTLLSYGDAKKYAIYQIAHILQKSTAQPCLEILPLPLMLPQIQTQDPSPPIITHPPEPYTRVGLVVKHPRVKTLATEPTSTPRLKPSIYPSLDLF